MIYVCLLRGINVGGNNKVSMKELAMHLEKSGFLRIKTYINSGNIIFESSKTKIECDMIIHNLIMNQFNVDSKVLILTKEEFLHISKAIPSHFQNDDQFKSDVLFYYPNIDQRWIDDLQFREGIDEVIKLENALIHGTTRDNQSKSALMKIIGTKLYFYVTIRNVNTVRKLNEILKSLE